MRIATYNIEWFTSLFDRSDALLRDEEWSARYDITRRQQLDAIAAVLEHVDADLILIVEAPDSSGPRKTETALLNFVAHYGLKTTAALVGFRNDTQQELAYLYNPTKLSLIHDPQESEAAPRFDKALKLDLDIDDRPDRVVFSKPPLEVLAKTAGGTAFRLIGCHLKSKAPHGASNSHEAMEIAIRNRRKQLAQCVWLRRRIDEHLDRNEPLIVLGDLNDGPGLDQYEKLFGRSGVEIVLGMELPEARHLYDPHAFVKAHRTNSLPSTARFFDRETRRYLNSLLDFIMVSEDLRARAQNWRIVHPFDDPECYADRALAQNLLTASDHFPVFLDIDL